MVLSKKNKKRIWQAILLLGLLLELCLIAVFVQSMLTTEGDPVVEKWKIIFFVALAIWIYIAYLKQRSIDISRNVVDEKIKTHLLVNNLREGIILLDASNRVMLINERAAAITGLNDLDTLGHDFTKLTDPTLAELLNSGRSGETRGNVGSPAKFFYINILLLPPDRDGDRHKLLYIAPESKHDSQSSTLPEHTMTAAFALAAIKRMHLLLSSLLEFTATLPPDARQRAADIALDAAFGAFCQLGHALLTHPVVDIFPDLPIKTKVDIAALAKELANAWQGIASTNWDIKPLEQAMPAQAHPICIRLALQQAFAHASAAGAHVTLRMAQMGANAGISILISGVEASETAIAALFAPPDPSSQKPEPGLYAARQLVEAQGGTLVAAPGMEGGLQVTIMMPGPA